MPTNRTRTIGFVPHFPAGFAQRYRGPVFEGDNGGGAPDPAQALKDAQARIAELNAESARHRLAAKTERENAERAAADLAAARAEVEKLKPGADEAPALRAKVTELEAAKTAAEQARAAAEGAARQTKTDAALRLAATKAGLIDMDLLVLVDASKITFDDKGEPNNVDALITELQTAKPAIFGKPGTAPAKTNTTQTKPAPKPADTKVKRATEMTDEEYEKARGNIRRGVIPA